MPVMVGAPSRETSQPMEPSADVESRRVPEGLVRLVAIMARMIPGSQAPLVWDDHRGIIIIIIIAKRKYGGISIRGRSGSP
jgi:hypothetical protein